MGPGREGTTGRSAAARTVLAELGHCLLASLGAGIAASVVLGLAVLALSAAP